MVKVGGFNELDEFTFGEIGAPERSRTHDLQIRSLPLYPAELRARLGVLLRVFIASVKCRLHFSVSLGTLCSMSILQELREEQRLISLALSTTIPLSLAAIGQVWALWALNIPLQFGWPFGLLALALGIIAVADAKQKLLPLSAVAAVGLVGLALNLHAATPWWQIAAGGVVAWVGTLLVGVVGSHFAGRTALGAGDVWLAGALGLVLGLYGLAPWLLAVAVVGGLQVVWLLARNQRGQAIPFAPALIFGAWLALLYGDVYYRVLLP